MRLVFIFNGLRGALTSKPYAFLARPWEFKSVDSVDPFDALGSNIRVDIRGDRLLRILPRSNDAINEDWISDRIRFVCDALRLQRLDVPLVRLASNDYKSLSWSQAVDLLTTLPLLLTNKRSKPPVAFYNALGSEYSVSALSLISSGMFFDVETAWIARLSQLAFSPSFSTALSILRLRLLSDRRFFLLNHKLADLNTFSSVVLVNFNVKLHAPLLAVRFRTLLKRGVRVYNFGRPSSLSGVWDVGPSSDLVKLLAGTHWLSNKLSADAEKDKVLFISADAFLLASLLNSFCFVANKFKFGLFALTAGDLSASEVGINESSSEVLNRDSGLASINLFYGNNLVERVQSLSSTKSSLNVLLGSHGGALAYSSDLVLPASIPFEQTRSYLNVSGVIQKTRITLSPPGSVLDSFDIQLLLCASSFIKQMVDSKPMEIERALFSFFSYAGNVFLNSGGLSPVWVYINQFFEYAEKGQFSISVLFHLIFTSLAKLMGERLLGDSFVLDASLGGSSLIAQNLSSRNLGLLADRSLTNFDFYAQDEVSLVSTTLSTASKRLNIKNTYLSLRG